MRISRADGRWPMPAAPSCAGSSDAPVRSSVLPRITRTTSCASASWARARVAPRSPTPTAGGSTPSEPAHAPGTSPAISTLTTAETSSSRPAPPGFDLGRSRHGAQLAVDQPSSDTGGSIPSRPTRASRPTKARLLPGMRLGSRPRARRPAAVAQPVVAPACRAEGHGFESRRRRHVDVAEWTRHRSNETGECRFDPCRSTRPLVVAQWMRASSNR